MSFREPAGHARPSDPFGFTLVEILVILAIIAVLAGVLVPVVTNQIRKAEAGRVTSDLNGVRTGMEAFIADVKRFPGDIEDLSRAVDGTDFDINEDTYPTGLQGAWDGPYIDRDMAPDGDLDTGFGGLIQDSLRIVQHSNSVDYVTILVADISLADFNRIDEDIDGGDGAAAGRLLHITGDTVQYLAIPIN